MKIPNNKPGLVSGTLAYLVRHKGDSKEVALALKGNTPKAIKRGLAGKRNSYGGGLEKSDASFAHCAARELHEECGVVVKPASLEKAAVITFRNLWGDYECHFFIARKDKADPRATMEMLDPKWFSLDALPFEDMMPADKIILPKIFSINPKKDLVVGEVWHNEDMQVIKYDLHIIQK